MKKTLLLLLILSFSVFTTACINNMAARELNNKAELYMDKGETETAVCRLKSSLELNNEIFQTHYSLAVAYNSLGRYEDALSELKKVIELNPDFADTYYMTGVVKEELAYDIIKEGFENGDISSLSDEQLETYSGKAEEAVDAFNTYIVKKPGATDTDAVNAKISELNERIKEFTEVYESRRARKSEENDNHSDNAENTDNVNDNVAETAPEVQAEEQLGT